MVDSNLGELYDVFLESPLLHFNRGELFIRPGENPECLFFIRAGLVRKYLISSKGVELSTFLYGRGDIFPWSRLIDIFPNDYYYEALTSVEAYKVPYQKIEELLDPSSVVYKLFLNRLQAGAEAFSRVEYLLLGNAYFKVISILIYLVKNLAIPEGENYHLPKEITQQKISTIISISRERVNIEIEKMKQKGFLVYKNHNLVVTNLKGLERELDKAVK